MRFVFSIQMACIAACFLLPSCIAASGVGGSASSAEAAHQIKRGEQLISLGEKQISQGESNITKGEELIRQGNNGGPAPVSHMGASANQSNY